MPEQKSSRRARKDVSDTFGIRGAGASWQADFGMPLNEKDLLFAVRREPVANRMVFKVAHDIFAKGFVIEEVAEKPEPKWSREVSKVLDGLNAKARLTQMVVYERLFGWAILAMTYVDYGKDLSAPVQGGKEIRELLPYCSLQCSIQSSEEDKDVKSDRYGLPVFYRINRSGARQGRLHFTRAIHCATRLLDHLYKGMSVLEPVYDDLTIWRNERWGLGQTLFRYGSGFPDIVIKGANKAKLDAFENSQQFKNLNARTHFMHDENTVLEFKGLAGKALNPEPYCTPVIESLSCGSGIPTAILRGAQAGALAGSEVNEREYFGYISDQRTLYEPTVWELIDRLMDTDQISKVEDYRVVWPSGLQLSEKDKATVELQLAQARNFKTSWMTIDEIRAEQGLGALGSDAGKVVLGVKKTEQQPFGQPPGASPATSAQADESRFERFVSWLRGKKHEDSLDK
jgi:phage-related protein (TIGR01555 family)